jgi:hypothetical protein
MTSARRGSRRTDVTIDAAGAVPDHQLEWSSDDPAGVIDLASGELESG